MDALRAVRDGRNPAAEKRAAKLGQLSPDRFSAVVDLFVDRHAKKPILEGNSAYIQGVCRSGMERSPTHRYAPGAVCVPT